MLSEKFLFPLVFGLLASSLNAVEVIRIKQPGYLPDSIKVVVYLSSKGE